MTPTLSVLLPLKDEAATLDRQLNALLPQLAQGDEVVCLVNGSTDATAYCIHKRNDPRIKLTIAKDPLGVCAAYDWCHGHATGDWCLGASGNDELQPGAIARWRAAAAMLPCTRVMFGDIVNWPRLDWAPRVEYIPPADFPKVWERCSGHRTHGAAAFIRRDSWGVGYLPQLEWMADWYQTLLISMREGAVYLRYPVSKVNFVANSFSARHNNDQAYNHVTLQMRAHWSLAQNDSIRPLGDAFHKLTGWLNLREPRRPPPGIPRQLGRCPGRIVVTKPEQDGKNANPSP